MRVREGETRMRGKAGGRTNVNAFLRMHSPVSGARACHSLGPFVLERRSPALSTAARRGNGDGDGGVRGTDPIAVHACVRTPYSSSVLVCSRNSPAYEAK